MLIRDICRLSFSSLADQRLRSFLTIVGIAVGIASVVLLTSIGEGVQKFAVAEFTQFGTNLIAINPGKSTTLGTSGAIINNVRPLSVADKEALRRIPGVINTVSVLQGNGPVEFAKRSRRTAILGVGPSAAEVWQIKVVKGRFLPEDDSQAARSFVVLGSRVKKNCFEMQSRWGR